MLRTSHAGRWLARLPLGRGLAALGSAVLLAAALAGCKNSGGY